MGINFSSFEEAKGTERVMAIMQSWLLYIKSANYETIKVVDLSGLRWGIAIILDAIERNIMLWNTIDYFLREGLLKNLFQLIYYCTTLLIMCFSRAYCL